MLIYYRIPNTEFKIINFDYVRGVNIFHKKNYNHMADSLVYVTFDNGENIFITGGISLARAEHVLELILETAQKNRAVLDLTQESFLEDQEVIC